MKRVSTILLGTLALLLLPAVLLAADGQLDTGRVDASVLVADDVIPIDDGYWHSLPGNPHAEAGEWTPDPALELVEERTEYMKVYRDPDNALERTSVIGAAPMHYKTEGGTWDDIDTTLVPKSGGVHAAVANRFQTFLRDRVRSGYMAEVRNEGYWVRFGEGLSFLYESADGATRRIADRADGTRARFSGNVAAYRGALGGDLVTRITQSQVEQHLVLSEAPAVLRTSADGKLVLRQEIRFSPGLTAYVDQTAVDSEPMIGNEIYLIEEETGDRIFRFRLPVAYETDANVETRPYAETHIGQYHVVREGNTLMVDKVFPAGWFADAERHYPVSIDPTLTPMTRPRTGDVADTGYVYRCGGCTGGEYERIFSQGDVNPTPPGYDGMGGKLRLYTNGANRQMKMWLSFDISGLKRYITTVHWARLDIFLETVVTWPGNHGSVRFNDVNLKVCDYAGSKSNGQTIYSAIDGGTNFLSSAMGGTSGTQCGLNYSGVSCMAPHWHNIDLCGSAPTIIKNNRQANLTYFNVGLELTSESLSQELRFQDTQHTNYPRVYIHHTVECTSNAHCSDPIPCTDNVCDNGRCVFPYNSEMCYIANQCYNRNYVNPANQCQKCNPDVTHTNWSNDNALACSDGIACTKGDHCSSGACVATPYTCSDGKACTTDICDGDGTCTFDINPGKCLIGSTCYDRFAVNPSEPCQECRDDWGPWYETNWGYDNSASCTDNDACTFNDHCSSGACDSTAYSCNDSKSCTQDVCNGDGTCTHNILAGTCYISNVCYNDEQTSPFNDCKKCDANVNQTGWEDWVAGHVCADDGHGCTTDVCNGSGSCTHPINMGSCLISNVCYSDFDDRPGDPCHECNSSQTQTAWSNVPNNTVSQACYPCTGGADGIGICHNGIQWCTNGAWGNCSGMQCPETDVCDYLDNDCDGNTDEDYPTLTQACDGGDYDECIDGGTLTCRENGTGVECVNEGAIAFFKLDEGTGNAVHTSSGIVTTTYRTPPRVGTISGANWTSSGHAGSKALIFDGADDYVDIPNHTTMALTTGMSMEAWIYPTAATGVWRVIGGLYNGGNGGYYMGVNFTQGPGFSAWFGAACGWKYSNVVPPLNKWTHVATTYNGSVAKLFVDGAKVFQGPCDGNSGSLQTSTSPMHIGGLGAYNPTQAPFAGAIDDFGVYKRALTEAEVKSRARSGDHCDGADNDCDGLVDEAIYPDFNTTGIDPATADNWYNKFDPCDGSDNDWCIHGTYSCAATGLSVVCTNEDPAEIPEVCDGLDNDCNTVLPLDEHDDDNDGFMICEGDCDDTSTQFNPAHEETCDGFDNNCDDVLPVAEQDLDADNHLACIPGQLFSNGTPLQWADCDDSDPRVHKDYPEVCDTIDNDCDGQIDDADSNYLAPTIDSYTPIGIPAGQDQSPGEANYGPQTRVIEFLGKNFVSDVDVTTFDFGYGVTVDQVDVVSTQQMLVTVTVKVLQDDEAQLIKSHDIVITIGNCVVTMEDAFDVYDPSEVPTLTEWGVIALSALLLGLGIVAIRRRRFGTLSF